MRVSQSGRSQPASACPPANLATNRPAYLTQIKRVGGPGLLPADFAYVTFGTNKFGFVMPDGFRLETEDRQKVTLVSADLNCLLTFRVLEPVPAGDTELDPAYYRDLLLSRHPGGKIVDEFSLAAVSRRGPAFDLRWNAAGTVPRRERVLFIAVRCRACWSSVWSAAWRSSKRAGRPSAPFS